MKTAQIHKDSAYLPDLQVFFYIFIATGIQRNKIEKCKSHGFPRMNKFSRESLKINPFTTIRDPKTGIWLVCFPDGTIKNGVGKNRVGNMTIAETDCACLTDSVA
jgi:hypothetical protein